VATKWFFCKKCETLVKQDSMPSSFHCPQGTNHQWCALAETGDINYQCKKCGMTIQCRSIPSSFYCPAGSNHQWHKL
jgi:predicted RNA-binding Zn-ribbon protein involved in translation (DUF1610 family)